MCKKRVVSLSKKMLDRKQFDDIILLVSTYKH